MTDHDIHREGLADALDAIAEQNHLTHHVDDWGGASNDRAGIIHFVHQAVHASHIHRIGRQWHALRRAVQILGSLAA